MFVVYVSNHTAGFNPDVVSTAANKGVLLALVAMAQTLPILTAGLDLSVGMVFILSNSLASTLVFGTPMETAFGIVVVLIVLLSMSVFERFSVEREMKERRMAEEEELQLLQERADALEEKVEHLQNTRGIEEELRNRFDVAREGEQVVIIVDDEDGRDIPFGYRSGAG